MRFLLTAINSKFIHTNPAVRSLQAAAGALCQHVQVAEFTINHRADWILEQIYRCHPDGIGFSCYIWNIEMIRALLPNLRKLLPDVPIWLGGPEVTYDAKKQLSKLPEVTGIMVGEGENTFRELLTYYCNGGTLSDISGLVYRDAATGEILETMPRTLTDLSALPFLYENLKDFDNKIIYYESSRGCPFRCSYCLSSIDKAVRFRDLALVKKELAAFLKARVPQVKFIDRTFNASAKHAMEIWQFLLENDNGVTNFHFEIEAALLSDEALELLQKMRPGALQFEIGVQSTNRHTLQEIRRHASFDKIAETVRKINSFHNIHQHLDLIAGLPYEDYASFAHSFNDVYALAPEQLQLGFLKVLRGSHMYEMADHYGIAYRKNAPYEVLYTKWISYDELIRLKGIEEMVETYYNSRQFTNVLSWLVPQFETPFAMYEALADYHEAHNLFGIQHSRAGKYENLRNFIHSLNADATHFTKIADNLLTYDWYLRENSKKRPAFAPDLKPFAEDIRRYYSNTHKRLIDSTDTKAKDTIRTLYNTTHIEILHVTQDISGNWHYSEQGIWYLFTYEVRNALDYNAMCQTLIPDL
ncbi:MAG: DUF4080 domain-containing protein [Lachnospiraceae bacterium]|nr:DUF4080 domain-containing protein [Lachnospiraceae bacterium]